MNYKDLLRKDEGKRNFAYFDTNGNLTIGIGHFLGKSGFTTGQIQQFNIPDNWREIGINDDQVEQIFENDLDRCITQLNYLCPWFELLDEVRQAVIINMCFNLGIIKFLKFSKTISFIKDNDFVSASKEMLDSDWARKGYRRAGYLSKMFETGEWPNE